MTVCTRCHHKVDIEPYIRCSRCREYQREYMRRCRGTQPRATVRAKALTWLGAPRTARQLSELLRITPQHAATMVWQLKRMGKVQVVGWYNPPRYVRAPGQPNRLD